MATSITSWRENWGKDLPKQASPSLPSPWQWILRVPRNPYVTLVYVPVDDVHFDGHFETFQAVNLSDSSVRYVTSVSTGTTSLQRSPTTTQRLYTAPRHVVSQVVCVMRTWALIFRAQLSKATLRQYSMNVIIVVCWWAATVGRPASENVSGVNICW